MGAGLLGMVDPAKKAGRLSTRNKGKHKAGVFQFSGSSHRSSVRSGMSETSMRRVEDDDDESEFIRREDTSETSFEKMEGGSMYSGSETSLRRADG